MNLARHSITATAPTHILDARFEPNSRIFTACTPEGFAVYKTWPLALLRKRDVPTDAGTLAFVQPMHASSLLFLVGGGRAPLYPANKVIMWDSVTQREVAELEFKEQVCGLITRRNWLVVALKRRVVAFEVNNRVERRGEWETAENERGLMAIATAPDSTMLAIPGRQPGHVQLIHLPPCPHPPLPSPPPNTTPKAKAPQAPSRPDVPPLLTTQPGAIIVAHESKLAAISLTASGRLLATASQRGTLPFGGDEQEVCVWSDKGTVHVFKLAKQGEEVGAKNRTSKFSALKDYVRLPKIFVSEWSYAQYRLPAQPPSSNLAALSSQVIDPTAERVEEERCTVAWIEVPVENPTPISPSKAGKSAKLNPSTTTVAGSGRATEYQLVALTYSGGWYRLSLPPVAGATSQTETRPTTPSTGRPGGSVLSSSPNNNHTSVSGRSRGEGVEGNEVKEKQSRQCILEEFRRFGRWDGWG
ncbi:hypothetical protein OPQ81_004499 [Rhizoctonia solani]|nr:hypothetical protein OPQ81_004499 [Rhizoctonia solani]